MGIDVRAKLPPSQDGMTIPDMYSEWSEARKVATAALSRSDGGRPTFSGPGNIRFGSHAPVSATAASS
jgi:hypothetical protein